MIILLIQGGQTYTIIDSFLISGNIPLKINDPLPSTEPSESSRKINGINTIR